MVVRFYPSRRKEASNALAGFLQSQHVEYEMLRRDELQLRGTRLYASPEEPIVEIDGKMFVNPNPQALRKILELAEAV